MLNENVIKHIVEIIPGMIFLWDIVCVRGDGCSSCT